MRDAVEVQVLWSSIATTETAAMAVASHAASMQRAAISDSFVSWGAKSLTFGPSCRSGLGLDGSFAGVRRR